MRLFNAVSIHFAIIIYSISVGISNAMPTTSSLALAHYDSNSNSNGNGNINTIPPQNPVTDLLPLPPYDLSPRDLSTPTNLLTNTPKLLSQNLTIALPSPNSITHLTTFYAQISLTVAKNIASAPKHYFTFTLGAYRMGISCLTEAIPWGLVNDIVEDLRGWMREGWVLVGGEVRFLGGNAYLVKAPVVIVVSVGLVGDLRVGGG